MTKFEVESTAMLAVVLHCPTATGNITSGPIEGVMLAVKAYRDHARETRGVSSPHMVHQCQGEGEGSLQDCAGYSAPVSGNGRGVF